MLAMTCALRAVQAAKRDLHCWNVLYPVLRMPGSN